MVFAGRVWRILAAHHVEQILERPEHVGHAGHHRGSWA
jgi:hypothetical protein